MFDLGILDVGIGLALVFLLVSLICSSIREAIESFLKSRAGDLERGVRLLLGEADGKGLTQKLFNQPLIGSLFTGAYDPDSLTSTKGIAGAGPGEAMPRRARQSLPSYIPAAHFASAVIDVVMTDAAGAGVEPPPLSVDSLRAAAGKISNDQVKGVILSAIDTGANDIAAVRASIETWFNGTMDRVSGWYKRRTQLILFVIGLATAVLLNVDAVTIAKRLSTDPALREVVVAQAGKVVAAGSPESPPPAADQTSAPAPPAAGTNAPAPSAAATPATTPPASGTGATSKESSDSGKPAAGKAAAFADFEARREQLTSIGLPIGWSPFPQSLHIAGCPPSGSAKAEACSGDFWIVLINIVLMLVGWLITAFAVMLGAPFWFDVLSKFVTIRSTLKPKDEDKKSGPPAATGPAEGGAGRGGGAAEPARSRTSSRRQPAKAAAGAK